jgi:hypothetical protein
MRKKNPVKKTAKKSKKKEMKKKKETTRKPAKKTITKKKEPIKKTAEKAIKKIKVKEKPKKAFKKAVTKIEKELEKAVKKVTAKVKRRVTFKPIKKVEPEKALEKPKKKVEVKTKVKEKPKKVIAKIVEKGEKIPVEVKKKEVYPETEYAPVAWEKLPSEYGENGITLMTVDPYKLFTFWEVRKDTLEIYTGNLTVRLYDVTGVDFDGTNANSYYDITVNERIGSCYIDVSPEKEFIADIGIINFLGTFFTIIRSNRVSTPRATIAEEGILPQKFYGTGIRVGY